MDKRSGVIVATLVVISILGLMTAPAAIVYVLRPGNRQKKAIKDLLVESRRDFRSLMWSTVN